jgi:hypothetical protein
MTMGDLVCSKCDMKFDEEMGPDDFPTGVTFTVTLMQGKPRDKTAIERIFNLGQSKMMRSPLRNPSSTEDTQGTTNNKAYQELKSAIGPEGLDKIREELSYSKPDPNAATRDKDNPSNTITPNSFVNYRNRIRRAYNYGQQVTTVESKSQPYDDQLLLLYFERRQHGN